MNGHNSRLRTAVTITIALLLVAALIGPAFAHAQLLSSDPASGASLPTLDRATLTFNEDINPDFIQVVVDGPDGPLELTDAPSVEGPIVTQAVAPQVSGAYTLSYRVVSADGHPISGRIDFTLTDVVSPPASAPPSTTAATATPEPTTEPTEEPTPETIEESTPAQTATDAGASGDNDSQAVALWLGAAGLAGLAGAGTFLARARRGSTH